MAETTSFSTILWSELVEQLDPEPWDEIEYEFVGGERRLKVA